MIPVLTGEEMKAVDQAASEPVDVLVQRAGAAVARAALAILGGSYGRRVVVVAGKGNNGADGRAAAVLLERRGVRVTVVDAAAGLKVLPPADLVVDAAYGTGFRGAYEPPDPGSAPVLAVDVPSGAQLRADTTVTFAALKPVLLLGDGPDRAGAVKVADIGLDVRSARMFLVEDADVAGRLRPRPRNAHKWQSAVYVAAGSPGMQGAPMLVARAAMRAGAGYVRLGVPGGDPGQAPPSEVVALPLPSVGWDVAVRPELERCRALVVGPGLGRSDDTTAAVRALVATAPVPAVVDADGLNALGGPSEVAGVVSRRHAATILTPHEGEFARLAGQPVGDDRVEDVRRLAARTGAIVLLKGSTTVVASPGGEVLFAMAGSPRLATAGTGDVLAGVVGAFLAQGLSPFLAAALAAHAHGRAAGLGYRHGLVAGDLPDLIARWLSQERPGG
ncbi:MAG: ADP-dependent NAD(P)H-hydrate dehydratase / NAD(P)H-hydrate epimerase [Acidimicrobiaceae bacterium]|nr:ADP-dependent NAD(P)H-hydrate dehydratase / NAD(P)H-hydrate epimerase [Acidimicrobiaceae bacterium]